jgi:hypothetical protein
MSEASDVLRDAVERVDALVAAAGTPEGLREAWGKLAVALALGPRPERRVCPFCGKTGMREATRCGYCWRALLPAADGAAPGSLGESSAR